MITRGLEKQLIDAVEQYPVVFVTGPRQSGKSTLLKYLFSDYQYVSLEDLDNREFARNDPRSFLATYNSKTIIDEAQHVPSLFSYIQTKVDSAGETGIYILSGSQNFLLMQSITQSLAGRVAVFKLLPFSHKELANAGIVQSVEKEIYRGGYPRLYDKSIAVNRYYENYIQTYVERDVRQIKNIGDLSLFVKFIKLCAGRIGQLMNYSSLANDCGIAVSTAQSWISLLEASYIAFLLPPDYVNFSKRLIKSPKLYFYDTGLACALLEIKTEKQLNEHYLRGGLFENLVILEKIKALFNNGEKSNVSFWRDSKGNEVDLIETDGERKKAIEIKSGKTFSADYFKGLRKWQELSQTPPDDSCVVYAGDVPRITQYGKLVPFANLNNED